MNPESPPYHENSEEGDEEASEQQQQHQLEIVVGVSIHDTGSPGSPQKLPPVKVKVDRRSLNGSPVHVKIGVMGAEKGK